MYGIIVMVVLAIFLGVFVEVAYWAAPFLRIISIIVITIMSPAIAMIFFKKLKSKAGYMLLVMSSSFGLLTWAESLVATYDIAGAFTARIGVLLGLVGVVPIALIVSLFKAQWAYLLGISTFLALTITLKIVGYKLSSEYIDNNPGRPLK